MVVANQQSIINQTMTNREAIKSFVETLTDTYVDQDMFDDQITVPKDKKISTQITMVGFGKVSHVQKQLDQIFSVDLSKCKINALCKPGESIPMLPKVAIINLANNNLTWDDIARLMGALPKVREVILSNNHLNMSLGNPPSQKYKSLASLTLGQTSNDWQSTVKTLSMIWTAVHEIDLWSSCLNEHNMKISPESEEMIGFTSQIRNLKLGKNLFTHTNWVPEAGLSTNLVELDLSYCELRVINFDSNSSKILCNLKSLNVSYNFIDQWSSISNLFHLRSIQSLICHENPILSQKYCKFYIIGCLKTLKTLNREEVTREIRRDSEILYLKKCFSDNTEIKDPSVFQELHPRYKELTDCYGLPEDLKEKNAQDRYISVELFHGEKRLVKKVPCDMKVSNFKMLCRKMFNMRPSARIMVECEDVDNFGNLRRHEIDSDGQTLKFFSITNGQKLYVIEDK